MSENTSQMALSADAPATKPRVPKRIAAVIINSLKGGVVPRIGLPYVTVGRETSTLSPTAVPASASS